jgi:metallo-beta-lactamase family protein
MKLQFLGGATTVTGSQFKLATDTAAIIVDCGLFQGSPNEAARNRLPLAYDPARIDAILLTHAHLDHCGLVPLVVRRGFRGPIHMTRATAELASLVLLDSAKIQVEQSRDRRERDERLARREQRRTRAMEGVPADTARDAHSQPAEAAAVEASVEDATDAAGGDLATHRERRGRGRPWPPDDWREPGFDPERALRSQPPRVETSIYEPLYDVEDAERAISLFRTVDYDEPVTVVPGIGATFRDAGHILGSAIIEVEASDRDGAARRVVFSGDLGRPGTPIIRDPTSIIDGADYVLVESTYGGREHGSQDEAVRLLAEAVHAVAGHSGVLLVPAFAIGRTQEIVWELDRLLSAGAIPHMPLYLDSPMASRASDIYARFPGYYDDETSRLLREGETPLDYPGVHITRSADESKAIRGAARPMMIVSASGMLTGGRVMHHLRDLVGDPTGLLLFVGYQGEGTLGAHLQAGAAEVMIDGQSRPVRCQVRSISGFSAHADESELLDWLEDLATAPRRPRKVFLIHGDPEAREAFAPRVRDLGLVPYLPGWREEVELA